jgi:hypothetical protein
MSPTMCVHFLYDLFSQRDQVCNVCYVPYANNLFSDPSVIMPENSIHPADEVERIPPSFHQIQYNTP